MKSFKYHKLYIIITVSVLFIFAKSTFAANLFFSSPYTIYTKGSNIIVNVLVSSEDVAAGAASGLISFPTKLLLVSSISKDGSIVDTWAQEPTFSNLTGTINFESVFLSPSFIGNSGKILTIIFKAKSLGTANIVFTASSVLSANDMGKDILTSSKSVSFRISTSTSNVSVEATSTKKVDNSKTPVLSGGVLEAPILTDYPTQIQSRVLVTIKGITKYPNSQVSLYLKDGNGMIKTFLSKTDEAGNFIAISNDILKDGIYTAWVQITDTKGVKSLESEKITIEVKQSELIKIGSWIISFLVMIVALILLILLPILFLRYVWYKFFKTNKKLKKEVREAEGVLHKAFDILKESEQDQIEILGKRKTKGQSKATEEKTKMQFKKDLQDAEKYVEKEIEKIDKMVK